MGRYQHCSLTHWNKLMNCALIIEFSNKNNSYTQYLLFSEIGEIKVSNTDCASGQSILHCCTNCTGMKHCQFNTSIRW